MAFRRNTFASSLLAAAVSWGALAAGPAHAAARPTRRIAQSDPGGGNEPSSRAALVAERQRVRAELERANGEIDALKRSRRGLRDDYRLRERLADAEALARRLTELDARLGPAAPTSAATTNTEPRVSAVDGPAEREAKADIIADQAQRLEARGDALLGRARDLRDRQTLRRRVGQMERDPFSPLEGSKRRTMAGVSIGGAVTLSAGAGSGPTRGSGSTGGDRTVGGTPAPGNADQPVGQSTAPPVTGSGFGGASLPAAGAQAPSGANVGHATAATTAAPTPTSASDAGALSSQLRDLLDPATLAQIRQIELAGGPGASFEALDRAGAALKARAARLRQQAASLRATEHVAPRGR